MTDIKRQVASAITGSNLRDSDVSETALDRVLAFGGSAIRDQGFGCALWRLKYANDVSMWGPVLKMLRKRVGASDRRTDILAGVCEVVLHEWLAEVCEACSGRGKLVVSGTPHVLHDCIPCDGTGKQRASEVERSNRLGLSTKAYAKWATKFAKVRGILEAADQQAVEDVNQLLGHCGRRADLGKHLLRSVEGTNSLTMAA